MISAISRLCERVRRLVWVHHACTESLRGFDRASGEPVPRTRESTDRRRFKFVAHPKGGQHARVSRENSPTRCFKVYRNFVARRENSAASRQSSSVLLHDNELFLTGISARFESSDKD